ncbi:MAG: hypothetical protein K8T10_05430 [Candidatus Eremiobacteraeota bacterium]|nr:hypothetical protein [Candidatus Eremiobacteraeota bacterium]
MGHIDPMNVQGFQPPVTAEVAAEAKKKLKETELESDEKAVEGGDVFVPSELTKSLPEKKKEAFMEEAKAEIAKLDPESETFVDDATQKLVNSALKNEYGKRMIRKKEYNQMKAVLTKHILRDPRYRSIIEDFLGKILESEWQ